MRKIDRLIIGELMVPWTFGVFIFTVLIMAGSFLFKFTELLARGVSIVEVSKLAFLLLPGILAKTFSMAMLLGTLLAFGRLSGDSEIVALRAAGVSVPRIMLPVAVFGTLVSLMTFVFNDYVVPAASLQATAMQDTLTKALDQTKRQPTSQPLVQDGRLMGYLVAQDFSLADRTMTDVSILSYDQDGMLETVFDIDKLEFTSLDEWQVIGQAELYALKDGLTVRYEEGAWPDQSIRPGVSPEDILARRLADLDSRSSRDIMSDIQNMKAEPDETRDEKQIANLEFGYWNKFSLPMAALVFGLVGAPLGIRSHRAGTATGFWLSVVIIFGYLMVTNAMNIMAQGGALAPATASFFPTVVGLVAAAWLIRKKNIS